MVCVCEIEGLEIVYTGWVSEVQVLLIISSAVVVVLERLRGADMTSVYSKGRAESRIRWCLMSATARELLNSILVKNNTRPLRVIE